MALTAPFGFLGLVALAATVARFATKKFYFTMTAGPD